MGVVVNRTLTVYELIELLKGYPSEMPVLGTYEGVYGEVFSPEIETVDAQECLVFDIEYGGR